ncbi:FAD/NAD(P)-binding domain-containing protein [Dendrothele bispora CBS 962.96]|uniref:FAD/NAD(P)-binding domain-containing protein n=1 Tax=Dendrothele bispora (strain CBS 962.96) TaxID=1314807 RepID=A0A4S8LEA4_DENBC|nr:FAD/NAD(P)-binding domain-containing protein [Dendrothele bispora CBS 962.96]
MSTSEKKRPRVAIIGAGIAGISTAIALRKQLHYDEFTIYEKASAVGGTWRDNTYPGCGSDVPGHWYSLSTELNPYWSSYYIKQPEIRAYWDGLFGKYSLEKNTEYNTFFKSAEWDDKAQRYNIVLQDTNTKEQRYTSAEVLIYGIGGFMAPVYPKDVPGVDNFHGPAWHSARWRHDISLKGKKVGVIGNGASAAQLVPEISSDPSVKVTNFCRTPQWYVPQDNYSYPTWVQWIFAHIPFLLRGYRNMLMARSDLSFLIFRKSNKRLLAIARKQMTKYILKVGPKNQLNKLVPDYPPGCKRILVDPGYLQCLHRPNVTLKWDTIESVVEDGIKLKTGETVPLDVIIFGTGFSLEAADFDLRGNKGTTIKEYFASKGGPTAYLGVAVPGFPNSFILLGPNVASGHASVIFSEEAQIQLILRLIKPILDGKIKSVEIKDNVTDEYNDWLQRRLETSVWSECNSYYHIAGTKRSKIVATFPGPVALYWWFTKQTAWNDWNVVGEFGQLKEGFGIGKMVLATVVASVVWFFYK